MPDASEASHRALFARHPLHDSPWWMQRWERAAVAMVLRDGERGAELLLVTRAERPGRRWSGHVGLPGGMREPSDRSLAHTARRECEEEVGLQLGPPGGRLRSVVSLRPRGMRPMAIAPLLFSLPEGQRPRIASSEVVDLDWVPLVRLATPRAWRWHRTGPVWAMAPTIELRLGALWGLTLQMVGRLLAPGRSA